MILKKQNGASAVELAILLPFLVLLVFGIIEFGLLLYNQQVLTNASREGARAAIIGACNDRLPDDEDIKNVVKDYCRYTASDGTIVHRLITFTPPTDPTVTVTPSPSACTPGGAGVAGSGLTVGDDVTVTVSYNYTFLFPSVFGYEPMTTRTLTAHTVMKMESAP